MVHDGRLRGGRMGDLLDDLLQLLVQRVLALGRGELLLGLL